MIHRNHLRVLLALCLFATLLPGLAAPSAAQCPAGVSGVTVELLAAGSADGSKERREHAFVSATLAQALGIDGRIDPAEDVNPQIRAIVDLPVNTGGPGLSANFTVAGTFDDPSWIRRDRHQFRYIYLSSAQAWSDVPAGAERFEKHYAT